MRRRLAVVFLVTLVLPAGALAGEPPPKEHRQQTAVDRWHTARSFYSMESNQPDDGRFRFGICPGVGLRAGNPGAVFGVADLYVSMTRRRALSLFAGVGVEGKSRVRSMAFTLGWGGVRRIHVARRQTGFFGAFLRYRKFVGEVGDTRDGALSVGTEVGAGHMGFTFELGGSRRETGEWKVLIYVGFKFIWAMPLGW